MYVRLYLKNKSHLLQVKAGIESLIKEHQTVPGNILRALGERVIGDFIDVT